LKVVQDPSPAIGENADVTLGDLFGLVTYIGSKLGESGIQTASGADALLHLDHGTSDFDIDPVTAAGRSLEVDLKIVFCEVKASRQK
jgi:hypothetical protein